MPRLSQFYGIVISMFYNDHPPPHFHVVYGEYEAELGIDPVQVIEGELPRRVQSLVVEWAALHQAELRQNWDLARTGQPLQKIQSLD